jgi:hypothetical protein
VVEFGQAYQAYQHEVPRLIPAPGGGAGPCVGSCSKIVRFHDGSSTQTRLTKSPGLSNSYKTTDRPPSRILQNRGGLERKLLPLRRRCFLSANALEC